ncbi:MAG: YfhO family protein [Bacteroidales bacterium]|nr:YfhO family protein [Bacteroidales bacterium]
MENNKKAYLQYIIPVILFFFISLAYFIPDVLEGKKLSQHDIVQFKGMSKEIADHREKYGEEPLWTNSMFGGMPAYLVSTQYKGNVFKQVHRLLTLYDFRPVSFIFLYLTGAFVALLLFGVNPWLSFAGAIAYAFSSYFFVIIQAGHVSKVLALGYMPPIIAGVYAAFRGKALLGSLVAAVFLSLQILVNHLQITYYTFLFILILGIFELVRTLKNNAWMDFLKPLALLVLFVILAIGANFSTLYTTYEYGKYSIRGKSELSVNAENKTSGLDKDYATQWSYGTGETFTLLIPNFKGGSSTGSLKTSSHTYDYIKSNYGPSEAKKFIGNVPLYWGTQPSTAGPVYVGAVVVFLFILGMFLVKGPVKWWLFIVTLVSVLLSWGSNFPLLTNFMLDYFPGYNKFRTVSMILIMAEFAMPLLAILAVKEIITSDIPRKEFLKALKYSFFGLAALILLLMLVSGSFDMTSRYDAEFRSQGLDAIVDAIQKDRLALLRSDAFRSLVFICLTAALIYAAYLKKIKFNVLIFLLSFLLLLDMWPVNKRYLNSKDFVSKKEDKNPFTASTADMIILEDKDANFKVLNLSVSVLQDASTSWFHKSLGGYHGAKMRRYQELFDHSIQNEISGLYNTFQKNPSPAAIDSTFATLGTLNMLNTRYIIYNPEAPPLVNKYEQGNAWFVNQVRTVANADEEIAAVADFDPGSEAIMDVRFSKEIEGLPWTPDSTAKISLNEYRANYLKYHAVSTSEQLAVFSEIFYDKGWQAYIDNQPVPHFRVNYVLRAMRIPAGDHTIEFKFHPRSYFLGEIVSLACSLLLVLMVVGTGYLEWKRSGKNK